MTLHPKYIQVVIVNKLVKAVQCNCFEHLLKAAQNKCIELPYITHHKCIYHLPVFICRP